MDFTVSITDPRHLAGITAAREARNASLLPEVDADGHALPLEQHPDYIGSDAAYVQFVMSHAAASYAAQYGT